MIFHRWGLKLCRAGFHRWGINTRWGTVGNGLVRWERHCTRCGTLLVFSLSPFLYGLDIKARRAVRRGVADGTDR